MTSTSEKHLFNDRRLIRPVYLFLLYFLGLTGFAQMPIFKRYYIADVPGLGWLAQFYVTHALHYIGAILLLFLIAYSTVVYFGLMHRRFSLTATAYINITLLGAIVVTGILRVLKNLPGILFSPEFTMFIDTSHLGFMMALFVFGIFTITTKRKWLQQ
jgi:hypothetical protein